MNLTDDQFATWMKALRSGDYKQTQGALASFLTSKHRFCCMGVCGVSVFDAPAEMLEGHSFLSCGVLNRKDPQLASTFTEMEESALSRLNDRVRLTFPQIAAFVEGGGLTYPDVTEALLNPSKIYDNPL